jgi:hypothetical protein
VKPEISTVNDAARKPDHENAQSMRKTGIALFILPP